MTTTDIILYHIICVCVVQFLDLYCTCMRIWYYNSRLRLFIEVFFGLCCYWEFHQVCRLLLNTSVHSMKKKYAQRSNWETRSPIRSHPPLHSFLCVLTSAQRSFRWFMSLLRRLAHHVYECYTALRREREHQSPIKGMNGMFTQPHCSLENLKAAKPQF